MSDFELAAIDQRISEINTALDLCLSPWDDDIIDNLAKELDDIIARLESDND